MHHLGKLALRFFQFHIIKFGRHVKSLSSSGYEDAIYYSGMQYSVYVAARSSVIKTAVEVQKYVLMQDSNKYIKPTLKRFLLSVNC